MAKKSKTAKPSIREVETYGDLIDALSALTDEQRGQPIQIADPPNDGKPTELHCGIALGTVGAFELEGSRSVIDNKYHADEVVLLIDANPFGEDGAMAYEMKHEGPKGKGVHRMVPIYGPGGPTKREDQRAPKTAEVPVHVLQSCRVRSAAFPVKRSKS